MSFFTRVILSLTDDTVDPSLVWHDSSVMTNELRVLILCGVIGTTIA